MGLTVQIHENIAPLFCFQSFKQQKAERARDLKIMEAYRVQSKADGMYSGNSN